MYTTLLLHDVESNIICLYIITLYSHLISSVIMRWGVLGCANIAKKNVRAILQAGKVTALRLASSLFIYNLSALQTQEFNSPSDLIAVASRNVDKGHAFIRTLVNMGILSSSDAEKIKVYGSYEDLISDADIDAVYVPLPSALHDEVYYFGQDYFTITFTS